MQQSKKILVIILVVLVVLGVTKNFLIKSIVTAAASQVVGAPVHIDSFGFGIFKQSVRIKGFTLFNPPGFPKGVLIDLPEIAVEYSLSDLLKGKLHLPLVVVNLKEMILVKNKEGKLNVDALKVSQQNEKPAKESKPAPQVGMQMDVVNLNLGKVIVKDYTKGEPPVVQAYDIGVTNKVYKNITSAEQFAALIMVEAMGPTAMRGAAIYSAATILGVGFLPAGVIGALIGKDSGTADFDVDFERAFKAAGEVARKIGKNVTEDKKAGLIKAKVEGVDVKVEIVKKGEKKAGVKVSARQLMLPKPEVANGVLYQITEKLK